MLVIDKLQHDLKGLSGEALLLISIFGRDGMQPKIDHELDRRASASGGRSCPIGVASEDVPRAWAA